ncbi:37S ribosomal protein [Sporothrix brasiliensis 5110]|uniref:37S ribosomal protein n=1 Tax=Sporothrix brasiliensis 5110 TaxID=1398154 RepID=A0A0C2IFY5_9PEZI|nr:37S ribosomal protein [Sporothrix brasiliensis 5110]KIH88111.1 37S ribosomal protein [Sporothrix brasiliensis 5110]
MASASSRSLQLGMRRCCAAATTKSATTTTFSLSSSRRAVRAAATAVATSPTERARCFSSTAWRGADDEVRSSKGREREPEQAQGHRSFEDMMLADKDDGFKNLSPRERIEAERAMTDLEHALSIASRPDRKGRDQFWNEDEPEPEMFLEEGPEDVDHSDEMTSMGHGKLEEIRDQRHLARIIAWEMPLLAKFAKPFEPPSNQQPLRFRYTSYMGELHPAEKKVVVEFCPSDLGLTTVQENKLMKLAGVRYNPETKIVRISCEMFEHQAQNKRYLGDLVDRLIAEAKDPTDTFEDIPLDTRHHKFKYKPSFPKEWRMTEERKKELEAARAQSYLLDQTKAAQGTLIDGVQRIQASLAAPAPAQGAIGDKVAELARLRPVHPQTPLQR